MPARRRAAFTVLLRTLARSRRPGGPSPWRMLAGLPRMVRLGLTGRYPGLDRGRLALVVLAVVYVVSPLDVVPELWTGLIGLGDDALVMAWTAGALLEEAERFALWERDRDRVVPGHVVDG